MLDYLMTKATCYWSDESSSYSNYIGDTCGDREISKEQIYADFISQLHCNISNQDTKTNKSVHVFFGESCRRTIPAWAVVSPFFLFLFAITLGAILSGHSTMSIEGMMTQDMMSLGDYENEQTIDDEEGSLQGFGYSPENSKQQKKPEDEEEFEDETVRVDEEYSLGDVTNESRSSPQPANPDQDFVIVEGEGSPEPLEYGTNETYGAPINPVQYQGDDDTEI